MILGQGWAGSRRVRCRGRHSLHGIKLLSQSDRCLLQRMVHDVGSQKALVALYTMHLLEERRNSPWTRPQAQMPGAALQQALVLALAQGQAPDLAPVLGQAHSQFPPLAMEQVPAHASLPEQVLGQALRSGHERQQLPSVVQVQALESKQALVQGRGLQAQRPALLGSLQRGQLLLLRLPAYRHVVCSVCLGEKSCGVL